MTFRRSIILFLAMALAGVPARAAALGDEDYHKWILTEIKKINSRLVMLENEKIKTLQTIQESLLRQIEEIKVSIQQVQGTVEVNKSETVASVGKVGQKLSDVQGHIKLELMPEILKQKEAGDRLISELASQFGQLKNELATDVEKLSRDNKQYFLEFDKGNTEKLQMMVQALNDQNQNLKKTQALLKSDLIPAIEKQNEANRKVLLTEMAKANAGQKTSLKANHDMVVASLSKMDEKNRTLIEILKKSVVVDEATRALAETLQLNIEDTNKNISQTQKTIGLLQEVLNQRLSAMAAEQAALETRLTGTVVKTLDAQKEEKVQTLQAVNKTLQAVKEDFGRVQEFHQSADPKLNILVDAAQQLSAQSSKLQLDVQQSLQAMDSNKAQADLANQKLARLIDILKTIAVEQGKMDQILQAQGEIKTQVGQSGEQVLKTQGEVQEALSDLKRKANVNISRNDDILKVMKNKAPRAKAAAVPPAP